MKLKIFFVMLLAFSVNSGYVFASKESDDFENGIIIDNLEMESKIPVEDKDEGQIIFDDSFSNIVVPNTRTKKQVSKKSSNKQNSISLIDNLQRKDLRWHFTKYSIKSGDNLTQLARRYKTSIDLICAANNITSNTKLKINQTILIPNRKGFLYEIKKGDSLKLLAKKYNISTEQIISVNNINKNKLIAGKKLFLPDAERINIQLIPQKELSNNNSYVAKNEELSNKQATEPGQQVVNAEQSVQFANSSELRFSWPLTGNITSSFGNRADPFTGEGKFHCGIDLAVPAGTHIKASESGKVIFSGYKEGYGNIVVISHSNGYITVYAHNQENKVKLNQFVKKGDLIALSGATGRATGPHLHFEIRRYMTPLNPQRVIK